MSLLSKYNSHSWATNEIYSSAISAIFICPQEKIRGQRGKLPVQPLGYVNCTKVIYRGALERKSVFRDVRIKANLDLMFLVNAK